MNKTPRDSSPLPWQAKGSIISDANGIYVLDCWWEDAARIVTAINERADLLSRIAKLERAVQHASTMLATSSEHITLVAEEMGCSQGNPDGGSPDTCEHCIDLRSARVIMEFVGKLNALLDTPPA